MEKPRPGTSTVDFEFINVTGGSGRERRRNNYLARAHAAKINRQNHKLQADSRRSKHTQTFSILPKTSTGHSTNQDSSTEDEPSSEDSRDENDSQRTCEAATSIREAGTVTSERSEGTHLEAIGTVPTPRSISPAYGALAIETFDWNAQPMSAQVGHYLLKVSWPTRSGRDITRAWWTEFCQSPIIYHVSHLASAVHRDLLVGDCSWSSNPEIILHKTNTIRLVNEQLEQLQSLDPQAVDRLIFAVTTLSRHEMEPKHFQPGESLLFTPHMPYANGMKPLGRLNLSGSARALLAQLVHSQGGLERLQIAGLGEVLALWVNTVSQGVGSIVANQSRIDILESSTDLSKPRFAPFWNVSDPLEFESFAGIGLNSPGLGFSNFSCSLPAEAVTNFRSLAHVDTMMAYYDVVPTEKDVNAVLYARNLAIHSVLSLPSWHELSLTDRENTDFVTYESCRIASLIYSNAVLLGLPSHNGWHRTFVSKLQSILEATDLVRWIESSSKLLAWILFIGAIASYRTPHRCFFQSSLRNILLLTGMTSWRSVRQCLGQFLWSESACEHGAAVIWDAMDLEGTWCC